ncbi:MAG TPA: AMP-binding protein, partial [Longimicrobium sp.]|nr:AMP-binding protein [Longimicrobium sp.]
MELEHERWTTTGAEGCADAHLPPKARPAVALPGVRLAPAAEADDAPRTAPSAWYGADADYPAEATLHALVRARALRTPDAPALVFGAETVTYAEMMARADALARRLRALGVGPERPVGLCVDRSPGQIIGLLGIL